MSAMGLFHGDACATRVDTDGGSPEGNSVGFSCFVLLLFFNWQVALWFLTWSLFLAQNV
jgi:hypothetical protein